MTNRADRPPHLFCIYPDVIAFLMIAVYSCRSVQVFRTSSLFGRVVEDATIYFLVIVWVHLTVLIYLSITIGSVSPRVPESPTPFPPGTF